MGTGEQHRGPVEGGMWVWKCGEVLASWLVPVTLLVPRRFWTLSCGLCDPGCVSREAGVSVTFCGGTCRAKAVPFGGTCGLCGASSGPVVY